MIIKDSVMKAYKGFLKDMTCRGFQFEEGKTYEEKEAALCKKGFHACEKPVDMFYYYAPGTSIFREVELDDVTDERENDSKRCARKIHIGAELSVPQICKLTFDYVKSRCTNEYNAEPGKPATAGENGAATAGSYGAATAGFRGAATAGENGAATAGSYGAATAGFRGAATAGFRGAATAGENGAATAGFRGAATAGENGAATSRGSSASGKNGISVARGNGVRVKGGLGALLVIAEEVRTSYDIVHWKAVVVDGKTIKPDTWYKLVDGDLVECEEK